MISSGDELAFISATEQAALIRERRLSPVELVELYLGRIERLDPTLNCIVLGIAEEALEQAETAEDAVMHQNELPLFHGANRDSSTIGATDHEYSSVKPFLGGEERGE